ncbi:gonadal protein gdl [Folsomia candida]|uniref:Gonadal protein gdl n=1 Tax=Folsomia candida TaxID=158441 RepID=A0A226DWY3_FOLCA|nr:gonadal protein gdl [Folsomia candida]XP_021957975.1 gonadal protein gdl [Folsomia candida]OXA49982.1 Gonadal protein gdl [Folsomia candida]
MSTSALAPSSSAVEKAQQLQNRLYFILEKLQTLARDLPSKYQQRINLDLLSGIANCLLHDTIFEIVKGLKEIQDVTEKHLFQTRLQLLETHRVQRQHQKDKDGKNPTYEKEKLKLVARQKLEVKQNDMKIAMQLDQKVSDQQVMLEKAGVPGFFVSNNAADIRLQMYLLEFILKLSVMPLPQVSLDDS